VNIAVLKAELTDDPLARGYTGMNDAAAAASLNAVNRTTSKSSMTGSEILQAIDETEYLALTDLQRDRVWQILHLGTVDPFGVERDLMVGIFGNESATIVALAAARTNAVSRGAELGLGFVAPGNVENARY
jgi:hypothetical protein